MNKFVRYIHHDELVFVREDLQGKHRDHCLCWRCERFVPDDRDANCYIASDVYNMCLKHKLVLPVWECPLFLERLDVKNKD